jgi:hypothetical protein
MIVTGGSRRPINRDDVVYDCGDLEEWSILQCRDFRDFRSGRDRSIPLPDLLHAIDKENVRFIRLWRVPDEYLRGLLALVPA